MFECPVDTGLAGAAAPTTLPHPGMPGSLSVTSHVIINTDPTEAVAVSLAEGSRRSSYIYAPGASVPITLTTSNPVRRDMAAKMYGGFIDVGGFTDHIDRRASFSEGETTQVLSFDLSIPHGCSSQLLKHAGAEGALHLGGGAFLADGASNLATVRAEARLPCPSALDSLASQNASVDATPPRVVSVRAASSSSSSDAQVLARNASAYLVVEFDRPVVVFDRLPSSDSKPICETCDQSGAYVVAGTASPDVLRNPGRQGYWYPLYLDKDAAIKEFGARVIEITFIQIPQVVFYGPAEDPEARRRLMCAPEFGWCHNPLTPRVEMLSAGLYNWTEEVVVEEEDTYVYYEGGAYPGQVLVKDYPLFADLIDASERSRDMVDDGLPALRMDLRQGKAEARYAGGSGTRIISMVYAVAPADETSAFEFSGTDALKGLIYRPGRAWTSIVKDEDDASQFIKADLTVPRRGGPGAIGGDELQPPMVIYTAPAPSYFATCSNAGAYGLGLGQVLDIRLIFTARVWAGSDYYEAMDNGDANDWGRPQLEIWETRRLEDERRRLQDVGTCNGDGTSYFYAESVDRVLPSDRTSAARSVSTNHCPNHAWTSLNGFKPLMKSTRYVLRATLCSVPSIPSTLTGRAPSAFCFRERWSTPTTSTTTWGRPPNT